MRRQVLIYPIITEKAMDLSGLGKYCFRVDSNATKPEIRKEIEQKFKVNVVNVNIVNVKGKERRRGRVVGKTSSYKKAVVTLAPGQKIDIYGGT